MRRPLFYALVIMLASIPSFRASAGHPGDGLVIWADSSGEVHQTAADPPAASGTIGVDSVAPRVGSDTKRS